MAKFDAKAYSKNVLRSAGYITAETIKGVNPTLTGYIRDTGSDMKEMYDNVKEFKRNPKGMISSVLEGAGFKEVVRAKNNILDDIRTGKFYNPEREKSTLDTFMKNEVGFDFDDFDFDINEDFGEDNSSSSGNSSSAAIHNLSLTQQQLTAASTDEIVRGYERGSKSNIANNTRMFGVVNNSLSVINSSIMNLHQDLATPLNNHIINSSNFYQTATAELSKQTAYLENMNKLLTERLNPPAKKGFVANNKLTAWNDIMSGGLPNMKKLIGNAKKKAFDDSSIGLIGDLFTPDMIEMIAGSGQLDSPLALILSMAATSKLQNSATGKSLNRLTRTLQSGAVSAFSRIHQYNKSSRSYEWNKKTNSYEWKNKKGISGWLANIFDIFPDVKGGAKLDHSKYNPNERANWTNKDSRALELIPNMLSNIYAAISGSEPQIYDYKSGTWKTRRKIESGFKKDRLNNIKNATSSFNYEVIQGFIDKANTEHPELPYMSTSSRAAKAFTHDYELVLQELTLSKLDISKIDKGAVKNLCITLSKRGVISANNVNIIVNTLYDNAANKAAIQNNINLARMADNEFMENSADSAYAMATNGNTFNKSFSDGILKVVDDKGNNMFFYLQHYYNRLDEIRDILSYGRGDSAANKYSNSRYANGTTQRKMSKRSYSVPSNRLAGQFRSSGNVRDGGDINIDSLSGRDIITSSGNIVAAKALSTASNKTEDKKKEEGSPVSRGIDKLTNWLSDILTGQGANSDIIKKEGLIGYIKTLPETISNSIEEGFKHISEKVQNFFKGLWDKAKETAGGKSFGEATKDILTGFGRSLVTHASDKANSFANWIKTNKPTWAGKVASAEGSYAGGQVTRSGMVSVSEGEMIVPSEYNPFYHVRTSKSHQKATEAMNYRNWVASGSRGGEYWGSFSRGSKKVKRKVASSKQIEKIEDMYNNGLNVHDIASRMHLPESIVKSAINKFNISSDVDEVVTSTTDTAKSTFNKIKNSDIGKRAQETGSQIVTRIDESLDKLFGKNWTGTKDNSKIVLDTIKKTLPQTASAGAIGAIVGGAMTGSGLGLLGGLVLGSGMMVLKNSDDLNKKLFGTEDTNGNFSGGKLPPKLATFIKKQLPGVAKSGALGSALGAIGIAPGGLLGGFVLGAGLDLLSQNQKVKDTVTQLLFGSEDVNGERNGGIVGSLKVRVVDPLADYVKGGLEKVSDYFKKEIFAPLKKAANAIGDWATGKGIKFLTSAGKMIAEGAKGVYHRLDGVFDGTIGRAITGAGRLGKVAINTAAGVGKIPFRAIGGAADALERHNIKRGYSTKSAQDRMLVDGAKNSLYTQTLAGLSGAEAESFIKQVDWYSNGLNKNNTDLRNAETVMGDKIVASLKHGGMGDPKTRDQLDKLIRAAQKKGDNDYSAVENYINGLDDSKMSTDNRIAVLEYIKTASGDIKSKRDALKDYDNERLKFFKDNKDKLGNMLTIDKNGNAIINHKALSQTAMQSRIDSRKLGALAEENLDKALEANKSKAAEEARLKAAAELDPIGNKSNSLLESILNTINKILGIQEQETGLTASTDKDKENGAVAPESTEVTTVQDKIQSAIGGKKKSAEYSEKTKAKIKELYSQGMTAPEIASKLRLRQDKVEKFLGESIISEERDIANEGFRKNTLKGRLLGLASAGLDSAKNLGSKALNSKFGQDTISLYSAIGRDLAPMAGGAVGGAKSVFNKIKGTAENIKNSFTEEHEEGTTKTETVDGNVLTYVWKGNKWNPDMSDSDTNKYFTERGKDNTLKNKFFGMFTSGSLLEGIKGIFSGDKEEKDKKPTLFDKLKEGALGLFDKFFGSNSIIGSAISGLMNGGIGSLLKAAFEGLVSSGTLTTILAGAGIVLGTNMLASKDAGTDKDAGMRSDKDPEERKKEVEEMGVIDKTLLGARNLENHITKKNMMAYSSDDFVSSYTADRFVKNVGMNLITGAAGGGLLGKAAAGIASNTIGKIPTIGKALAAPLTISGNVGSALSQGTSIFKNAAGKLVTGENGSTFGSFADKYLGRNVTNTLVDISDNGVIKTASNSKVGQSIAAAGKKFSETGAGKAIGNIAEKIKEKVQPIFKWVLDKLGVKEATQGAAELSNETAGAMAGQGGNKLGELLSKVGSVIYVARIILAAEDGFETAKSKTILGIIDPPTITQRLLAAALNAINYAIPGIGGIIPTNILFNLLYFVFEKFGIDLGGIEEERAAAKETLAQYREATNNPGATLEEYIHNELGEYTTQEKVKKFVGTSIKNFGTSIKNFGSNVVAGAKDFGAKVSTAAKTTWDNVKTGTANAVNRAKEWGSNVATNVKDFASATKSKFTSGVDFTKEAITSFITMGGKMDALFSSPDAELKDVIGVELNIPDTNPLANIAKSISGIVKIPITLGLFVKGIGKKIGNKVVGPIVDEIKTLGNIGVDSYNDSKTYVSNGDLVGLWTRNSDNGENTGLHGIISNISDFVINYYSTLPTIGYAIFNKIKEGVDTIKEGAANVGNAADKSKETLSPFRDAGDISGLWNANSASEGSSEDGFFSLVPLVSDFVFKSVYFVPTAMNMIGNKVSDIFDSAKSAIPDFGKMVDSLWSYTDTTKDMSSYDSTVDSFKTSGSGFFNGIGNGIVSGAGAIFKVIVSAMRLVGGVVEKVTGAKDAVVETATNIKDTVVNTATNAKNKVVDTAQSAWNTAGNFINGVGTSVMHWLGSGSNIHVSQKGSNRRFGNSNIDQNGCGPASAATILRAYGKNANINDMASYAESNGYVAGSSGVGTRASYFGDVLGANGISTAYTGSKSGIRKAVKSGRPTVLLGQDNSNRSKTNSPFGPNPHYVVARGSDAKGNVFIDDPELGGTALYNSKILNKTKLGIMTGGGSNTIKESDGAVWNYLKSAGLSDAGTAGLMGNLYAESGITFNKVEAASIKKNTAQGHDYQRDHGFSYDSASYTAAVDKGIKENLVGGPDSNGKPTFGTIPKYEFTHMPWITSKQKSDGTYFGQNGYGLVQWTTAGRKEGLYDLAKSKGVSISDPQTQLEYLVSELRAKYPSVLSTLTSANDIKTASNKVLIDFEAPDTKNEAATQNLRAGYGQTYYNQFTKNPPTSKDFGASAFVAANNGSTETSFPKYNLDDKQLAGLANIIQNEQSGIQARYAEASLMANLVDKTGNDKATPANLIAKATGGWFAKGKSRYEEGYKGSVNIEDSAIRAARDVLVYGKRTVPRYVDEHDCFSDIKSIDPSGTVSDRSAYKPNETTITNTYGSKYKFYSFPDAKSDPFGYIEESLRQKWGDGHYTIDNSGNITTNSLGTMSSSVAPTNGSSSSENPITSISSFLSNVFSKVFNAAISKVGGAAGKVLSMLFGQSGSSGSNISENNNTSINSTNQAGFGGNYSGLTTSGATSGGTANGFPFYLQGDPQWANHPYGSHGTLSSSACGPTSMAMVLKSYGTNVTPVDTADWSANNGFRADVGTSWGYFKAIGSQNGLTVNQFEPDINRVKTDLQNKVPVIASMKPGHFTKGGHFVVFTGIDQNGNVYVNDPSSAERSGHSWDPNQSLTQAKQFWEVSKNGQGSIGTFQVTSPSIAGSRGGSSGLPMYDFTKSDRFKSYTGRASDLDVLNVPASTTSTNTSATLTKTKNGKVISEAEAAKMSYEEKMNKMIEYLSSIATNTGYAAAIPQMIELMGEQTKVMAHINAGGSSATNQDVNHQIDTEISSMMSKLDAIATSI